MKKFLSILLAVVMTVSIALPTTLVTASATTDSVMQSWSTKITTASDLAYRAKYVAQNVKTLYVMGCFGAPMTQTNKDRYSNNHEYNRSPDRTAMIQSASSDTFGFDCVCLIKGLLWGWRGDTSKVYGGATYASNGVPDIGADQIINVCSDVSTDFSNIQVGELVWMPGHVGIYVGDGLAVECTPSWKNCVQITSCNRYIDGYNQRNWSKHGKLPYVEYEYSWIESPIYPELVRDVESFVSNLEHREYIGTMLQYYISSDSSLSLTLENGKPVVFMFEGGSDNYPSYTYSASGSNIRNQAITIVVKKVNGVYDVVFVDENSSSIPSQPEDTSGGAYDRQTVILDGIYKIQTCNHNGQYGALNVITNQGYYTPSWNKDGVTNSANGINIHTRSSNTAGYGDSAWSWGCQLVGTGNSSENSFNQFMKVVTGINYNVWLSYSSKQFNTVTSWQDVGYYVVDRRLAKDGLLNIYNATAIAAITRFSTNAYDLAKTLGSAGSTAQGGIDVGTDFDAYIINTGHWMHLTNEDDGNVTLRSETGAENQIWHFERLSDGSYKITSAADGNCLDVKDFGTTDGTNVGTWPYNESTAQKWYINGYSGAYTFKAQCANTVLDVADNSNKEGTNIHMWTPNGSSAQLFQIWKVEAHTHNYSSYTVDPTCSQEGYTVYSCEGCGHSYYSDYTDSLGCEYYVVETVEPTCTEEGYTLISCRRCNEGFYNYIDPIGHYYGKWYQVYAPTCTESGLYRSDCMVCGDARLLNEIDQSIRTLWVTGINLHNENIQKTDLEGMGIVYTRDYYGGSWWIHVAFAPVWDGTYEVVNIVNGLDDGSGYAIEVPDGGFVWAANYGNDYYSLGIGDIDYKNPGANECIALAKSWEIGDRFFIDNVDFEGETVATSTPELVWYDDEYECLSNIVQVMYADATGHNYYSEITHPTCTEEGYTTHTCWYCGESFISDFVAKNGHSYGNWYTVEDATCTKDGEQRRDCRNCYAYETRDIKSKGHAHGEWITVIHPEEGKEGERVQYCTRCGDAVAFESIPALDSSKDMIGDINGNGEVEKYDYILVKRSVLKTIELSDDQLAVADVNGNGEVEKYDYILIKRHVMGTFSITK